MLHKKTQTSSMFANNALLGVGLGLGLGLENKERSKENPRHYYAFDGKLGHHSKHHSKTAQHVNRKMGVYIGLDSAHSENQPHC